MILLRSCIWRGVWIIVAVIHGRSHNGRFLRHRFSPKSKSAATPNSLPKRNHVAKEAVSAARQTQNTSTKRPTLQTERGSKDEAAALRKNHENHVVRQGPSGQSLARSSSEQPSDEANSLRSLGSNRSRAHERVFRPSANLRCST